MIKVEHLDITFGYGSCRVHAVRDVSFSVAEGESFGLVGESGSGKSTLASVLLGSPEYVVTKGSIRFKGDDITDWSADVRGKAGLFLAFQYPLEVPGVSTYIHPVDESTLLTIGIAGGEDGTGLDWSTTQVSLFDVSDPNAPTLSDSIPLTPAYTDENCEEIRSCG